MDENPVAETKTEKNNKANREMVLKASWLCKMFNREGIAKEDKSGILRNVILDHKKAMGALDV